MGAIAGLVFFVLSAAVLWQTNAVAHVVFKESIDESMTLVAELAAGQVDVSKHAVLQRPEQHNGREYQEVVAPLRRLLAAAPQLKYIYTLRNSPEGPRFVVDAAEPIDSDGDGVIDQATLNDVYLDHDAAMLAALADCRTAVSDQPYKDKWGTFISAYAPIRRADGTLEGVVGVDVVASDYARRLSRMDRATMLGGGAAALASVLLGLVVSAVQSRRRHAMRGLSLSEARTRLVIDTALDAVVAIDEDGRVTEWNTQAAHTFGYSREEAMGRCLADLIIPVDQRRAHAEGLARFKSTGLHTMLNRRVEARAVRKDGRYITIELSITHAVAHGVSTFNAFLRDISDRKAAEQEILGARQRAEVANQAKSEFLANMSHEIRTPMTAILGFADLLEEFGDTPTLRDSRIDAIRTIKRHGHNLLAVINDILDLSKIEAGKMSIEQVPCSPGALAVDTCDLLQVRARDKGIALECRVEPSLPAAVLTDPVRLRQILINLIGNAVKFTESGSVRVRGWGESAEDGRVRVNFEIVDTGIGMTPEQVSRLFGAFEQADTSMARRFGGTGLGLRISQRLAGMLGGEIRVSSALGRGTSMTLSLSVEPSMESPVKTGTSHEPPQAVAASGGGPPLGGCRVLLAEDGKDNQRLIAFHLQRAGAEVVIVENGHGVLERLTAPDDNGPRLLDPSPFHVILMDMQMPEFDGYSTARWLRDRGCALPIIALTAHAMSSDREKCISAGCDDYTTKPIDRSQLIALCSRAFRGEYTRARRPAA